MTIRSFGNILLFAFMLTKQILTLNLAPKALHFYSKLQMAGPVLMLKIRCLELVKLD